MGARVLASMAWLALGLITVSPHTTEAGCRWDGTAPACNGKCRADEIEVARIPDRGVKEPDYGELCLISGKKALCCTRWPSGQVWREASGTLDVVCVTPDKPYVKDDGTCATGKTCKAIQKPSLAGDWAGKNIDMPGGDYTNFNLNSEHPSDCRDAASKTASAKRGPM